MRDNAGILVASFVLLGAIGLCCVGGAGAYVVLRSRAAPVAAVPTPPRPVPPPPLYPPSGPAIPMAAPPTLPAVMLGETTDTPVRGPASAPIAIHVVSDFQCPFCSRVEPTLAQVDAAYPGRIRWVWHDYPLPLHANAMPAAEAAREVRAQLGDDAFWRFHDLLFAAQRDLSALAIERLAASMPGIDMARFRSAVASHAHEAEVRTSIATIDAARTGTGTPSFQVGTAWVVGAQPFSAFQTEIDRQLVR
jgi:protein-disulfide isomerase